MTSFNQVRSGGDIRVGYPIFEYTRLFMTLRHEVTKIDNVRNPSIDEDIENGTAVSVRTSLRYDERNNVFEPTDGQFINFSMEYAGFYGDQQWAKASLDGRWYQPVYEDLIFRSRLKFDQLYKTTSRALPRSEKFQMGGSRNMRGYNFEDIGPQENLQDRVTGEFRDFNVGGLFSMLGQFELEQPLVADAGLKWVIFYDVGNVIEKFDPDNLILRQNYGYGFRWFSPIGVLRFEFGYPIDPPPGVAGQQFHFDIGQLF